MEKLAGPNVHVILTVYDGRGFEFVGQNPILVEATLENNRLDASLPSRGTDPRFGIEFLWETTKQAARRLRTAKVPARLEFFTVVGTQKHKKIGFLLLKLSGAHIASKESITSDTDTGTWHKLICESADAKVSHPQILAGLRIADEVQNVEQRSQKADQFSEVDSSYPDKLKMSNVPFDPKINKGQIVQVGPEHMGTTIFSVEIETSKIYNLKNILNLINGHNAFLVYKIFGASVTSEAIGVETESSKTILIVRSSVNFLYQHLQNNPNMKIRLLTDSKEIATCEMNLANLIPNDNFGNFMEHHGKTGILVSANHIILIPTCDQLDTNVDNESASFLNIEVKIQCKPDLFIEDNLGENYDQKVNYPGSIVLQGAGETYSVGESSSSFGLHQGALTNVSQHRKPASTSHISSPRTIQKLTSHSEPILQDPVYKNVQNTYTLDVSVENILFHKLPAQDNFFFKFHHHKAAIFPTAFHEISVKESDQMICLENIRCKFKFVLTPEEVSRLLITAPPYISICSNIDSQTVQLAVATLDTGRLFVEKKATPYSLPLIDASIGDQIGSIFVMMRIEESASEVFEDGPVRLAVSEDTLRSQDNIVYNIVEELQVWKERQQEIFNAELIEKEKRHMNLLATEFKKRRDTLQKRLERDLLQCQTVIQTLKTSIEENRATSRKQAEMEAELQLKQEELDRKYKIKFDDLREASKRMEDELQHQMKMVKMEKEDCVQKVKRLEKEVVSLKKTLHNQEVDFEMCQKNTLSKEQITSLLQETKLLQEKLKEANESKNLFKEQWARAVREIHKIKCDHQETIQIQIRDFKEELRTLGFQRFLNEDECELQEDKKILKQMRSYLNNELDNFDDYPQKLKEMFPDSQEPADPRQDTVMDGPPLLSDECNLPVRKPLTGNKDKLQQLVRERDALLRTGTYSMDDVVVEKINQEIRKQFSYPS